MRFLFAVLSLAISVPAFAQTPEAHPVEAIADDIEALPMRSGWARQTDTSAMEGTPWTCGLAVSLVCLEPRVPILQRGPFASRIALSQDERLEGECSHSSGTISLTNLTLGR